MSVLRTAVVLLSLAVIGLGIVHLRARRVQHVHQIQQLRADQTQLQQALWAMQLEKARLCAPHRLRERAASMNLAVVSPLDATKRRTDDTGSRNQTRSGQLAGVPRPGVKP